MFPSCSHPSTSSISISPFLCILFSLTNSFPALSSSVFLLRLRSPFSVPALLHSYTSLPLQTLDCSFRLAFLQLHIINLIPPLFSQVHTLLHSSPFSNTFTHQRRCHQGHLTSHFYLLQWPLNFILTNLCFFLICYGHLFDTWSWVKTLNCSLVCTYDLINHKNTMDGFIGITQSGWNGMPDVLYLVKSMLWKHRRSPFYIRKLRLDCVLLLEYLLRLPVCFSCYQSTDCISWRHGKIFLEKFCKWCWVHPDDLRPD